MSKIKKILLISALFIALQPLVPLYASGGLKNNGARSEEFMDWGLGMFVHWSMDSQLGAVITRLQR